MPTGTVVYSGNYLGTGDHVSWPTELSDILSHHAIVVAPVTGNWFKVIHVINNSGASSTAPSTGSSSSSFQLSSSGFGSPASYKVCEETVDLSQQLNNGTLYRYEYDNAQCNTPAKVVRKARQKLGVFPYDTFKNNCEHFAVYCKTGYSASSQVDVAEGILAGLISVMLTRPTVSRPRPRPRPGNTRPRPRPRPRPEVFKAKAKAKARQYKAKAKAKASHFKG